MYELDGLKSNFLIILKMFNYFETNFENIILFELGENFAEYLKTQK